MAVVHYPPFIDCISGGIGNVVFVEGQTVNYIRSKGHYTDPKTKGQVGVRDVFYFVSHIAKIINTPILKPYTYPRPKDMTPFNWMLHINQPMFESNEFKYEQLKIFDGPLYNPGINFFDFDFPGTSNEMIAFEWLAPPEPMYGNRNDVAIGVIYYEVIDTFYIFITKRDIGAGGGVVNTGGIPDPIKEKFHGYLVFVQLPIPGTNQPGIVSRTAYSKLDGTKKELPEWAKKLKADESEKKEQDGSEEIKTPETDVLTLYGGGQRRILHGQS